MQEVRQVAREPGGRLVVRLLDLLEQHAQIWLVEGQRACRDHKQAYSCITHKSGRRSLWVHCLTGRSLIPYGLSPPSRGWTLDIALP